MKTATPISLAEVASWDGPALADLLARWREADPPARSMSPEAVVARRRARFYVLDDEAWTLAVVDRDGMMTYGPRGWERAAELSP